MVARVIRDGERYHPPAVPDPIGNNPFSAANDPHGAKKAAYLRQISNREDSIAELCGKEPKQATRFIINLDSTRFARYKADVNNWAKNNIKPYPRNLEEAYESASTHKDPSISTSTTSGTAYVAEATRGRGKGRGRGRGRGERSGPRAKEDKETTSASSGDSKTTCTKPCPI